jgi:hypothetical protein
VELYGRVRYAVQIEGLSHRAAARRFGIDPRTVAKMMKFTAPPGYVRTKPPAKPKLDPFIAMIDRILLDDKSRPSQDFDRCSHAVPYGQINRYPSSSDPERHIQR